MIGIITNNGKPSDLELKIEGFLDSYEYVDFDSVGRVQYDYKRWISKSASLVVYGQVNFKSYFFNWGSQIPLPVHIKLINVELPEGIEVEINKDGETEAFVPGYTMILQHLCKKGNKFQIKIKVKQVDNNVVFDKPVSLKLGLEASINRSKFYFFSKSLLVRTDYTFFIGPDLGNLWIGFDPGTSGSCIAAGNPTTDVIIEMDGKEEVVTPSVLAFNSKRKPTEVFDKSSQVKPDLFEFGFNAQAEMELDKNIVFQSIKKLLGFKDERSITFSNGKSINLKGVDLSSLLVKGVYKNFKEFIESNPSAFSSILEEGRFLPRRAVVTIPNNFTAPKTMDMIKCIESISNLSEIRYITEAEAVLCYYIYQHTNLHPKIKDGLKDETVLIFDMGGATINTTIADVTMMNKDGESFYDIDIDSKIGYSIGGDTIDYCLAKTIFDYKDEYPVLRDYDPFDQNYGDSKKLRSKIQKAILNLKKLIIKRYYETPLSINDNGVSRKILLTPQELGKDILGSIVNDGQVTIKNGSKLYSLFKSDHNGHFPILTSNAFLSRYVYFPIEEALKDVTNLAFKGGGYIDTVIFSGRSCMFPLIKEKVRITLGEVKNQNSRIDSTFINPVYITLDKNELKTAVVKGACWYGIHKDAVKLSPLKVNSTFGAKRTKSANKKDIEFYPLVSIGAKYDTVSAVAEGAKEVKDKFQHDGSHVNFYQVMGKDALNILQKDEKHKYSRISSIQIDSRTLKLGTTVSASDKVECSVITTNGEELTKSNLVVDQEVAEANEEHYTWIIN